MAKRKTLKIGNHTMQILPSGSYRVRIEADPVDGKRTWVSFTDPDPQVLIEKVTQYKVTAHVASRMTFGKGVDEYITTCKVSGLSPSTIRGYVTIRNNAIRTIESMAIDTITMPDVQRLINERAVDHSPKTVRNEFGLIHKVLSVYAPRLDLSDVKLPKVKRHRNQDAGIDIPTDEQLQTILAHAKDRSDDLYLSILLASLAGMRRSEICALTWDDINSRNLTITINKAIVLGDDKKYHLKDTKSDAGTRILSISRSLCDILDQYRNDGSVVHSLPSSISKNYFVFKRSLRMPGSFHDLRHYHCSVLIMLGIPKEYIMADMGHSTDTMYQKVYAHLFPDAKRTMYESIAKHADKILTCDTKCDTASHKPL